MGRISEIDFKT